MTSTLFADLMFDIDSETGEIIKDALGVVPICPFCDRRTRNQPYGMNCRCPFEGPLDSLEPVPQRSAACL